MLSVAEFNKKVSNIRLDGLEKSFSIYTMTVCGSIVSSVDQKILIDMKELINNFGEEDVDLSLHNYKPTYRKSRTKKKKGSDVFYNSLTIKTTHTIGGKTSNLSVKLFPNGNIQVAGCKTIESIYYIFDRVLEFVVDKPSSFVIDFTKLIIDILTTKSQLSINRFLRVITNPMIVSNVRISMINSGFKFPFTIHQKKINDLINSRTLINGGKWFISTFQQGHHSGVNSKFVASENREIEYNKIKNMDVNNNKEKFINPKGLVTVIIFRTGSIIITGVKNLTALQEAFTEITQIILNIQNESALHN